MIAGTNNAAVPKSIQKLQLTDRACYDHTKHLDFRLTASQPACQTSLQKNLIMPAKHSLCYCFGYIPKLTIDFGLADMAKRV